MDIESLQGGTTTEPTPLSRPVQSVITTATRDRFDAAAHAIWPLLVARLRRAGASPEDAEDVAQEALLRAWDRNIHFADDGDLLRWCTVVARRSHIDRLRQQARLLDLNDQVSDSACRDLEAVEFRHVLGTVNSAMASLTAQERASLQTTRSQPHGDRASQVRTAVARHRARYRLRLLVGPFAALVAPVVRTLRRGAPIAATAGALAAAVLTVTIGPLHHGGTTAPVQHAGAAANQVTANPPATTRRGPAAGSALAVRPVSDHYRDSAPAQSTEMKRIAGVQGPPGNSGTVDTRPKKPDDHLLCIHDDALGLGERCIK